MDKVLYFQYDICLRCQKPCLEPGTDANHKYGALIRTLAFHRPMVPMG